jgi:hypothetical protein
MDCSRDGASAMGMVGDADSAPMSTRESWAHRESGKSTQKLKLCTANGVLQ